MSKETWPKGKKRSKLQKKKLNKMEIRNLSDTEFKTLVIRMFKELSEDLGTVKKTPSQKQRIQ